MQELAPGQGMLLYLSAHGSKYKLVKRNEAIDDGTIPCANVKSDYCNILFWFCLFCTIYVSKQLLSFRTGVTNMVPSGTRLPAPTTWVACGPVLTTA